MVTMSDRIRDRVEDLIFEAIEVRVCNSLTNVPGVTEATMRTGDTDHEVLLTVRGNSYQGSRMFRVKVSEVR